MPSDQVQVVTAGHICLDIIPAFRATGGGLESILAPGKLINIGPAVTATGGAVSNTGLALHRMGIPARLMGKIGDDRFGSAILEILRSHDPALADGMIVTPGEHTSYTIVISPPGIDRMFLHCPGANDTFGADDVAYDRLEGARLFHFGYPPIMRRMFIDGGVELAAMLGRVREMGLTTSLDMASPDPDSEAGRADWPALLERVLPHVDLFMPSFDEILFMLDRKQYETMVRRAGGADIVSLADDRLLADLAQRLIEMGAAIVVLKLGRQGLYAGTTTDRARLAAAGACAPNDTDAWTGKEFLVPCFKVEVVGTTGAGDCAIAGFLAGLLHGQCLEDALTSAVAAGAFNVEQADATSGIRPWNQIQQRIKAGWPRLTNP